MGSDRQGVSIESDEGSASLKDLFRERSQLLVYHFMFGYGARLTDERRGCTGCSLVADHFDGVVPHLNGRDITLVCAPIAPLQELELPAANGLATPVGFVARERLQLRLGVAFTEEQRKRRRLQLPACRRARAAEGGYERFALQEALSTRPTQPTPVASRP